MHRPYQDVLQVLNGLRLAPVGSVTDMLWMHFGDSRTIVDRRGRTREVGEWALHLQCPWRFVREDAVILASLDFYYVAGTGERYDWKSDAESVFHQNSKRLNHFLESTSILVNAIRHTEAGAFDLFFDQKLKLTVLPTESHRPDSESWRFFTPGNDAPHFVYPEEIKRA